MDSESLGKKSFLWDVLNGQEDTPESPIDFFPSRVPEAVVTPRNGRNDQFPVGTLGTVGTRLEILASERSDLGVTPRNGRNDGCPGDVVLPALPGVPPTWIAGVYRLRSMQAPKDIDQRRWARFQYDALRLLHEHGAALYAAGWDEVDVFGLHRLAPDRRPDGMGLAWLIKDRVVAAVEPSAVMIRAKDGVEQRVYRRSAAAKLVAVPAWDLAAYDRQMPS